MARELTYREALREALREEMMRDERVFIMGEDIAAYGGAYAVTKGLVDEFGEKRVRDTPLSEEAVVGSAIGAAMVGLRPVVELMTVNFGLLAMDQIVNNAAKMRYMFGGNVTVPIVIRMPGGGGTQRGAQHSQSLEPWFAHTPGLKVVMPATPYDAKGLLKASIRDVDPVIFIEHELLYRIRGEVPEDDTVVPLSLCDVKRRGKDVTLVTYSFMLHLALDAARELEHEGVDVEVIDLRTIRPLDLDTILESVRKTHHVVTLEEGWRTYGISAGLDSLIYEHAFDELDAPIERVAGADVPMPYAANLEKLAIPSRDDIVAAVRKVLG
ncbi:MAG: pyruvate dehydrogenase complex E1 component subunit beta [Chloroflexi bacterium]|nr:pyruvate dehydrogenase complex E1 component subunit beta [Chloroflexota bacterium]